MAGVESNIWKLYLIKALRWFMLIMPIIVLFFQDNGLSMSEVLLLQSIFSAGIVLFEIPSGYFSDVVGRKVTIIIGCVLGFIGFSVYSLSYDFIGFLIAELTLSLGSSFLSGTDSAMIYDSLLQLKREKDYKAIEGRVLSIGNFSEAIASFLGGFVALISLRFPFYVETLLMFLTIPIAFTLVEPRKEGFESNDNLIKELGRTIKYSIKNKEVKWLILYSGFIGASTLTMVWFIQPYLKLVRLPLAYFGIILGFLNLLVGVFSLYAHKLELIIGKEKSLIILTLTPFIGYLLLGLINSLWSITFLILFYFVRGISGPVLKDYINRLISSNMRATVLSVKNLIGRLIFSIIGPFIGWVSDVYSLRLALMVSGFTFLSLSALSLFFLRKQRF